jgi:hypothetical protein
MAVVIGQHAGNKGLIRDEVKLVLTGSGALIGDEVKLLLTGADRLTWVPKHS